MKNTLSAKAAIFALGACLCMQAHADPFTSIELSGQGTILQSTDASTQTIQLTSDDIDGVNKLQFQNSGEGTGLNFQTSSSIFLDNDQTFKFKTTEQYPYVFSGGDFTIKAYADAPMTSKARFNFGHYTFSQDTYQYYGSGALKLKSGTQSYLTLYNGSIFFGMDLPPIQQGPYLNYKFGFEGDARVNGKLHANTLTVGTVTLPSDYMVAVDGKVICEEVYVRNSDQWPDYVFDQNYQLKSLSEVEDFIREEKHLPDVPSADAISQQGISLGEMQKIQMQKIEELTLYLIELKKENQALKVEVEKLAKHNKQ